MGSLGTILVGVAILVGVVGVVVPILPGTLLVLAAVFVWAVAEASTAAWIVVGIAVAAVVAAQIVKYVVPARRLRAAGVPTSSLVVGGAVGIVGFFVIPFVGLFIGFPLGVYAAERARLPRHDQAWRSTRQALGAVGLSMLIELAGALTAAAAWTMVVVAG